MRSWHETYGLPVVVTNCSNNYGPYHFPEKLIPLVILKALDEEPLPVYGLGANVRDWLFVEDHARALEAVVQKGRVGESCSVGGGRSAPTLPSSRRSARFWMSGNHARAARGIAILSPSSQTARAMTAAMPSPPPRPSASSAGGPPKLSRPG